MKQLKLLVADDRTETTAMVSVGLLIGSDYYWEFFTGRTRRIESRWMAVETTLGWVLESPSEQSKISLTQNQVVMVLKVEAAERELQEDLHKFWRMGAMGITKNSCKRSKPSLSSHLAMETERQLEKKQGKCHGKTPATDEKATEK